MNSTTFAERLREERSRSGLSQYALAKKSGLTKQALSRLELGEREPTWQTVQLLAAALNVDCTAFVDPSLQPPEGEPAKPRGRPRKDTAAETPSAAPGESKPKRDADVIKPAPAKKTRKRKGTN